MLIKKIKKLLYLLCHREYWIALKSGVAAGIEHEKLLKLFDCNTVVDIGANKGQFALVARKSFPKAKIHSFEPLELPAKKFQSVFSEDENVKFYNIAIGPEAKTTEIHVSAKEDSSSLLPISKLQNDIFPGTAEVDIQEIKIAPLWELIKVDEIKSPALLKIDVQGYELEALKGCKDILYRFRYVYIECSFVELYTGQSLVHHVIDYLKGENYILSGIYNIYYDKSGEVIQADFLFTNHQYK